MYCGNCGLSISEKAEICPHCGVRPLRNKNFCYNCGTKVNPEQEMCISCGVSLNKKASASPGNTREPWLMALLSFLITGLGQILVGQVKKGAAMLIGSALLGLMTAGLSAFITTPISIIDAYLITKKINQGKQVADWEFF